MAGRMRLWADRKGGKVGHPDWPDRNLPGTLTNRVEAWLQAMAIRAYSPRSLEATRWAMRSFLLWAHGQGVTLPDRVTPATLETWQRALAGAKSATGQPLLVSTQRARLGHVQRFFAWLFRGGQLQSNPAAGLELPRRQPRPLPRTLSLAQVQAVLAVPDVSDGLGLRDRAILEVLYATGIRRRELVMLDVGDVDFTAPALVIRHGKGNKSRVVPLGSRATGWLERYTHEGRPLLTPNSAASALFLTGYGGRFSVAGMGNLVHARMSAAGIREIGCCHLFRHACATHMLERGADIRVIQQLLGHVRLETTAIYTDVTIALLKEVHTRCHPHGG